MKMIKKFQYLNKFSIIRLLFPIEASMILKTGENKEVLELELSVYRTTSSKLILKIYIYLICVTSRYLKIIEFFSVNRVRFKLTPKFKNIKLSRCAFYSRPFSYISKICRSAFPDGFKFFKLAS